MTTIIIIAIIVILVVVVIAVIAVYVLIIAPANNVGEQPVSNGSRDRAPNTNGGTKVPSDGGNEPPSVGGGDEEEDEDEDDDGGNEDEDDDGGDGTMTAGEILSKCTGFEGKEYEYRAVDGMPDECIEESCYGDGSHTYWANEDLPDGCVEKTCLDNNDYEVSYWKNQDLPLECVEHTCDGAGNKTYTYRGGDHNEPKECKKTTCKTGPRDNDYVSYFAEDDKPKECKKYDNWTSPFKIQLQIWDDWCLGSEGGHTDDANFNYRCTASGTDWKYDPKRGHILWDGDINRRLGSHELGAGKNVNVRKGDNVAWDIDKKIGGFTNLKLRNNPNYVLRVGDSSANWRAYLGDNAYLVNSFMNIKK